MSHTIDPAPCTAPAAFPALPAARSSRDVLAELAAALEPRWSVHCETDYEGDVSIIVLPEGGHAGPIFVLYEKDDLARMGTVSGDAWTADESFSDIRYAMTAIIARTVSVAMA